MSHLDPDNTAPADSLYGNNPARWLVVFNTADADSVALADAYRLRRGVPETNMLGLDLPTTEVITDAQYSSLAQSVNDHLAAENLTDSIMGIVLSRGTPGFVKTSPTAPLESVAAWLQSPDPTPQPTLSHLACDTQPERPLPGDLLGMRMTATLDTPTPSGSVALLDRADALAEPAALRADNAELWLDPLVSDSGSGQDMAERLVAWGTSLEGQSLRVPIRWSREPGTNDFSFASFSNVARDGFFFGASEAKPPSGFFAASEAARAVCFQFRPQYATAETLRDPAAGNWITEPIAAGYAAAIASSRVTSYGHVPYPTPFFAALRRRWTLGEAMLAAMPVLADGFFLVGDPLLTCLTPREGWDVFGPVASLDRIDPGNPAVRLPANARQWTLPAPAEEAASSVFTLHRSSGNRNANLRSLPATATDGAWSASGVSLAWPLREAWSPRAVEGRLEFFLQWRDRNAPRAAARADLEREEQGTSAPAVEWSGDIHGVVGRVTARLDPAAAPSRYRWTLRDASGEVVARSPWSAWRDGEAIELRSMTLLEDA